MGASGQGEGGVEEGGVRVVPGELLILLRAADPELHSVHERHASSRQTENCLAAGEQSAHLRKNRLGERSYLGCEFLDEASQVAGVSFDEDIAPLMQERPVATVDYTTLLKS